MCAAMAGFPLPCRLVAASGATAVLLASFAAHAQGAAPGGSATPAPSAAPSPTTSATSPISPEAKQHFAAGVSFLQDPDGEKVEEAYREFKTAYDLSGSPKILGNMGLCAMKLERDGEAIDAYARYLREVPDIDPDERAQIVRDLQTLTVGVARVTVQVNKPGVRIIDVRIPVRGERVTNVYGPVEGKLTIGMRPGHHVITARLAGHEDSNWEIEAYAGGKEEASLLLREKVVAPPPGAVAERPANVAPWIVMGVGGAMLAAGAVTGVVALGKTSDIERECPNDICPLGYDLEGSRSDARTFVRLTDALLVGGGVVAAGGFVWWLVSNRSDEKAEAPKTGRVHRERLSLPTAACTPAGCGASWGGTF